MTARQVFKAMLTELNNTNSPSLLLDDYNHFINKAIGMYINKRYANYDTTQQTSDDLRVLKATAILPVKQKIIDSTEGKQGIVNQAVTDPELLELLTQDKSFNAIYEVNLPSDYLHTLNCLCIYGVNKLYGCYDPGDVARYAAKRLTADSWSTIVNDYYNRPEPERPYYYIHNINTSTDLPTNPYTPIAGTLGKGTDPTVNNSSYSEKYILFKDNNLIGSYETLNDALKVANVPSLNVTNEPSSTGYSIVKNYTPNNGKSINLATVINVSNKPQSTIEKTAGVRYGNASTVRMEIRYGQADVFELKGVMVDYVKTPQHIRLTKNQMDLTEDTSQVMEFPDYVCHEIINELVKLVMANNADPRIQTVPIVSLSIADPVRQLAANNARAAALQQAQA